MESWEHDHEKILAEMWLTQEIKWISTESDIKRCSKQKTKQKTQKTNKQKVWSSKGPTEVKNKTKKKTKSNKV